MSCKALIKADIRSVDFEAKNDETEEAKEERIKRAGEKSLTSRLAKLYDEIRDKKDDPRVVELYNLLQSRDVPEELRDKGPGSDDNTVQKPTSATTQATNERKPDPAPLNRPNMMAVLGAAKKERNDDVKENRSPNL